MVPSSPDQACAAGQTQQQLQLVATMADSASEQVDNEINLEQLKTLKEIFEVSMILPRC